MKLNQFVAALGVAFFSHAFPLAVHAVIMQTVLVDNVGNGPDPATGAGAVGYQYYIGRYEVTVLQYTEFLNAVARSSDPHGLYNTDMATHYWGAGIGRSGNPGSYTYHVSGSSSHPVTMRRCILPTRTSETA